MRPVFVAKESGESNGLCVCMLRRTLYLRVCKGGGRNPWTMYDSIVKEIRVFLVTMKEVMRHSYNVLKFTFLKGSP